MEGFWKQHELWDGTYTITDLLDIHESMTVFNTNKQIVYEYEQQKAEAEAKRNQRFK